MNFLKKTYLNSADLLWQQLLRRELKTKIHYSFPVFSRRNLRYFSLIMLLPTAGFWLAKTCEALLHISYFMEICRNLPISSIILSLLGLPLLSIALAIVDLAKNGKMNANHISNYLQSRNAQNFSKIIVASNIILFGMLLAASFY